LLDCQSLVSGEDECVNTGSGGGDGERETRL